MEDSGWWLFFVSLKVWSSVYVRLYFTGTKHVCVWGGECILRQGHGGRERKY